MGSIGQSTQAGSITRRELAAGLGISQGMVSRLAQRGMPTHDLERAKRWRARHLAPARMKGNRAGTSEAPSPLPSADRGPAEFALQSIMAANRHMQVAAALLEADQFALAAEDLRQALRRVPVSHRDQVQIHVGVFDALTAGVHRELVSISEGQPPRSPDDADLEEMGRFWYAVAAGEITAAREDESGSAPT